MGIEITVRLTCVDAFVGQAPDAYPNVAFTSKEAEMP